MEAQLKLWLPQQTAEAEHPHGRPNCSDRVINTQVCMVFCDPSWYPIFSSSTVFRGIYHGKSGLPIVLVLQLFT